MTRGFSLGIEGHPTKVEIHELDSGQIGLRLITERNAAEPLTTTLRVCPTTFNILAEAINRAAHDQTVWHELGEQT